jgi:uncharacterized protein
MTDHPLITIRKLNLAGQEVFAYSAEVMARTPTSVVVEATFARYDRLDLGYTVFERGDRFVEHFYSDRWYNVFEVYTGGEGQLKGWYCNVTRPAVLGETLVSAVDLALDLFVYPDGRTLLLDEDEFAELPLDDAERRRALAAVEELRGLVDERREMFGSIA